MLCVRACRYQLVVERAAAERLAQSLIIVADRNVIPFKPIVVPVATALPPPVLTTAAAEVEEAPVPSSLSPAAEADAAEGESGEGSESSTCGPVSVPESGSSSAFVDTMPPPIIEHIMHQLLHECSQPGAVSPSPRLRG